MYEVNYNSDSDGDFEHEFYVTSIYDINEKKLSVSPKCHLTEPAAIKAAAKYAGQVIMYLQQHHNLYLEIVRCRSILGGCRREDDTESDLEAADKLRIAEVEMRRVYNDTVTHLSVDAKAKLISLGIQQDILDVRCVISIEKYRPMVVIIHAVYS